MNAQLYCTDDWGVIKSHFLIDVIYEQPPLTVTEGNKIKYTIKNLREQKNAHFDAPRIKKENELWWIIKNLLRTINLLSYKYFIKFLYPPHIYVYMRINCYKKILIPYILMCNFTFKRNQHLMDEDTVCWVYKKFV